MLKLPINHYNKLFLLCF